MQSSETGESRIGQPWGKLVRVASEKHSVILLFSKEFIIGGKKGCDLSFSANKLVSGNQCKIIQDEDSGEVWLENMSVKGTVINESKVVKSQKCRLQNGDIIYVVHKKNEPEQEIAYMYQAVNAEEKAGSDILNSEAPGSPFSCSEISSGDSNQPNLTNEEPSSDEPVPSTSMSDLHNTPSIFSSPSEISSLSVSENFSSSEPCSSFSSQEDISSESIGLEGTNISTSVSSGSLSFLPEKDDSEPPWKKRKTTDSGQGETQHPEREIHKTRSSEVCKETELKTDKMEESLTCIICQDLLYDCVSLQPCMHTFCAACYSGWMERSSFCPTCRCPVERIRKNHMLNNLVEAYLLQHPEKCRSAEELQNMDSRNKISQDMVQPKVERNFSDEEGSSDYLLELSDVDSESSDISQPWVVCRQCPWYRKDLCQPAVEQTVEAPLRTVGEAPSTSSSTSTVSQEYMCPPQGGHVMCSCCFQPMPDRRAEAATQQNFHQQCMACQRSFCHMYWGCTRVGCLGCLAHFNDLNLTEKCMDGVLNNNNHESDILKNYLTSRGMTWKDMLHECLRGLQQGVFYLSDYRITGNAVLCYCCGLRSFKELAYQYRQSIPRSELPALVTSRPDCYWGRNCRTQVKAHHAIKFNHICEQTRFKN
ncbi:E3 ubiquitin-protein ligase CHFR isoform X2 [Polypterus senegalus]|uniref:E3 ubiquitin-protein ligase CHFR isoform X2 n=1 Tax=Polypterus senegalus TaxID=55291 RepID=UPI001963E912|nr:E3 ubiquitin-protein ligase CHFR isoform X2 [Polypterus senegalus]